MSHEVELKFRIPASQRAAVRRAVATRSAQVLPLAARYLETADGDLARARVALRLRQEGDTWVQTLKAEGRVALQRLEHNVPLNGLTAPEPDIRRHDGTEAGARLREVLAAARHGTLREHYATQIMRTWRRVRHQGAVIELALDEGEIRAGALCLPVCELEFELVQGPVAALLDLAARWVMRFDLWLDVRSKSERGHALAHEAGDLVAVPADAGASDRASTPALAISPATRARAPTLPAGGDLATALAAMLGDALQHTLANASQMADGHFEVEHLHQLRVGMRRLRSVLRLYGPLWPGYDAALGEGLAALFTELGERRDRDVRERWLAPALRAAGAPAQVLAEPEDLHPTPPANDAASACASGDLLVRRLIAADTQIRWLRLLAMTLPADDAAASPPAAGPLAPPLQQLWRQIQRDARAFGTLNDSARHRLRRRIKRLRYVAELSASLWPSGRLGRLLKALQRAQDPLGVLNDSVVAAAHARQLAERQPQAWFAVGWLAARHDAAVADCLEPMAALAAVSSPWSR